MDERKYDRAGIVAILWHSKAGCVGIDESTCRQWVDRLCSVLQLEPSGLVKTIWETSVAEAKSDIPDNFRRAFVKALLETESKHTSKELLSDILFTLACVPVFFFLFTELGRNMLPHHPPSWMSSRWMLVLDIGCFVTGIVNVGIKLLDRNDSRRARNLEKLLL